MSITLNDERLEPLGKNIKIIVSDDHAFGTDAILLANFANLKKKELACDLGTGCGIIPMLWCMNKHEGKITAIDIQKKAYEQLKRSIEFNTIENIQPINADLRNLPKDLPLGKYDLVTMNPPYKPVGTGIESMSEAERIARHEVMCSVDDMVTSAAKLLKYGGRLCLCHRPERLCDIVVSMRKGGIEVKKIRFVSQTSTKQPWLVLVEGKKGGKSGVIVMPNLVIKDENNNDTQELKAIFGDYMT